MRLDIAEDGRIDQDISIHAPLAGCDAGRCTPKSQKTHFNPRTPCGVRLRQRLPGRSAARFQSTHPLRGATPDARAQLLRLQHFNPRTPCGVRPWTRSSSGASGEFQSTHPLRGATCLAKLKDKTDEISIHAPLAGCDLPRKAQGQNGRNFNPRTPCGVRPDSTPSPSCSADFNPRAPCGARPGGADSGAPRREFQSTRPLRGATLPAARAGGREDISIHAPLAGRDPKQPQKGKSYEISIHAPLAGRDPKQPQKGKSYEISIHAPLAGRDGRFIDNAIVYKIFQSTRPLRGATAASYYESQRNKFQSTRPLRGATSASCDFSADGRISIHAPLAGRDGRGHFDLQHRANFNPRAPCGARPWNQRK